MKTGDIVEIQRGAFASYMARVVAIHGDTFEGAITIFGRTGTVMFSMDSLLPEQPVAETRTDRQIVREEYRHLRAANVPHEDAVVEAAIVMGFEVYDADADEFKAPKWVWDACK